jgi:hypothetical protein
MSALPDLLDDDGYPTEAALEAIKTWPITSLVTHAEMIALLEYVREAFAGYGYFDVTDEPKGKRTYHISTGGWSGNEDVIEAMAGNFLFWSQAWATSRKGGHYTFEVKA